MAPFDIKELRDLTSYDELELDTLGEKKTALFVIISDTDATFNFIVSIMYIKHSMKSTAPADCVTEIRIGNSVLVVSGFFKQSATETAADKMAKVLEAEAATQKSAI